MQLTPRWYKLREHDGQHGLWTCSSRFVVVPCGRRSGKSEIAKRKLVLEAINPDSGYADPNYFAAAPTRDQAQRIYWKDLKALIPDELITEIKESKLVIELYNGASIYVVGMDKPERLEGIPWNGGILDEYGNMKPKAWAENVRPALSDRNGWCWLIGVPEGRNHYYDLYLQAMEDKSGDWAVFQWPSSDILPASEIESARRMLDDLTFAQEYEACHCLDTKIQMADFSEREISQVKRGDMVLSCQNNRVCAYPVLGSKPTGRKEILQVELETGELFSASACHKMRIDGQKVQLQDCSCLEKVFVCWEPLTKAGKLAALVGASLSDGTITRMKISYNSNGKRYTYQHLRSSFYSKHGQDLELISQHLFDCGLTQQINKVRPIASGCYEVCCSHKGSQMLVRAGAVIGKKVEQDIGVPKWIKHGTLEVKRAFCAAMFGAEGSTPSINAGCRNRRNAIQFSISNIRLASEVNDLLNELGVSTTFSEGAYGVIYAKDGFAENVGFLYCEHKAIKLWLFGLYELASHNLHRQCKKLRDEGNTYVEIARRFGLKRATAAQFAKKADSKRIPSWFPTFDAWCQDRCSGRKIKLPIVSKKSLGTQDVWNITVGSPDHSYILANGLDNFNSFVSFSGRAYYNFDIAHHVSKALQYNPNAPLIFCFDFNVSPGVAVVVQEQILPGCFEKIPNPRLFQGPDAFRQASESKIEDAFIRRPITGTGVIGEVHIAQNSTTPAVCRRLIMDWGDHEGEIFCYGDASGGAKGSAQTQGSDWDLIYQILSGHYGDRVSLFVPRANPPERSRVNAMNTRLKAADGTIRCLIDASCEYLIKDFEGVRVLEGGSGEIDKKRDPKLTHLSDSLGYFVAYEYPVQAEQELLEFPIANRF